MNPPPSETVAKAIARRQVRDLDGLALIGHPTRFIGLTRNTVAFALYLAARDVIEREIDKREGV